jgi:hypothetical protein
MSVILSESEWTVTPDSQKRVRHGKPEVLVRHIQQGRWGQRWVLAAILPNEQIRELSRVGQQIK